MAFQRLVFAFFFTILPFFAVAQTVQLADSLRSRGLKFYEAGNFRQAEFYLAEAVGIYKKNGAGETWLATGIEYAEALVSRSKYNEATTLFSQLKKEAQKTGDMGAQALIENDLGWTFNTTGKYNRALTHLKKALSLAKEARDSLLVGIINDNIGYSQEKKGAYSLSLTYRKRALSYFEKLDNERSTAITLNNIGLLYEELFLYDRALEYYERSLEIRKNLTNVDLLATVFDNIGDIQKDMGNFNQALIAYQKSLRYRKSAGNPNNTAITLNNLGILYNELGEPEKALTYYRESLQMKKNFSSPASLAATYKNIAARLWDLGKREEATNYYEQSLKLKKQTGNRLLVASALLDLARMEAAEGKTETAFQYSSEASTIADSTDNWPLKSETEYILGYIHSTTSNYERALTHFKKSYSYAEFLTVPEQLRSLQNLSYTYHNLRSDSAITYGQKAVALIERGRSQAGALSSLKSGYFTRYSDFYISLASWMLEYGGDVAEAYRLVEAAKARTLSDELAQASRRLDEKLPEKARIERNEKLSTINNLYSKLQASVTEKEQEQLQRDIRNAELAYAAYESELHDKYPEYKLLESPEPVALSDAQALLEPETAILEYAVTSDRLIGFFISEEEVVVKHLTLAAPEADSLHAASLSDLVRDFKDAILAHTSKQQLSKWSIPLYDTLVAPFEEKIANYSNLLIVPDGALAYLPFEALSKDGRYLIEQFDIKYEPSVTSFKLLKDPQPARQRELLAVAGSSSSGPGQTQPGLASATSYATLPSTLIEVDSIASHFNDVTTLKDEEVTEQAFKSLLRDHYRFIHLATHGIIDEERPNQSGLALSSKGGVDASSAEDGMLRSSEIYRLDLNSDMVVLSACNSGVGEVIRGEGMLGLQRSFFYAGTSTVVVSLWNVYDRSTAYLMNEFYKSILNPKTENGSTWTSFMRWIGWDESIPFGNKAAGMREAKLKMINHPLFNHPVYWAPFVVVGR